MENLRRQECELPNMVIIDKRIVYYGGINPFMYGQQEETVLRIEDPQVACDLSSGFKALIM